MAQLQLAKHQIRDLEIIRDLDSDLLRSATSRLDDLPAPPLQPDALFSAVKDAFGGDKDAAESVMRQCLSLNGLMRQSGIGPEAVIGAVREAIQRHSGWEPEELEKWELTEPVFRELLCLGAFRVAAKVIELSYEYANLYRKGRILTDIRPLFSNDASKIEAAVVSFTFRLRYDSLDASHELSIAMDDADVRELARQCDRALKKAGTARSCMESTAGIPTVITGATDDD